MYITGVIIIERAPHANSNCNYPSTPTPLQLPLYTYPSTTTPLHLPLYNYPSTTTPLQLPLYNYPSTTTPLHLPLYTFLQRTLLESHNRHNDNSMCIQWNPSTPSGHFWSPTHDNMNIQNYP